MSNILDWNQWEDCHSTDKQQLRLQSACKARCTPLSVDKDKLMATFQGSNKYYITSLSECNCEDFNFNELPCKHMYRLAIELGIMNIIVENDTSAIQQPKAIYRYSKKACLKSVSLLRIKLKELYFEILSDIAFLDNPKKYIVCDHNEQLDELVRLNFLEYGDDYNYLLSNIYTKQHIVSCLKKASINSIEFSKTSKDTIIEWCVENIHDKLPVVFNEKKLVRSTDEYMDCLISIHKYIKVILDNKKQNIHVPITQIIWRDN